MKILYHYTDALRFEAIQREGLKPHPSLDKMCDRPCIWFTEADQAPWLKYGTHRLTVEVRKDQVHPYSQCMGPQAVHMKDWKIYFPEWWVSFDPIPATQIVGTCLV